MQNLLDAVKQVKQTIQAHKADLMNNEALTRYALVDVILNALGWDVHNPAKVFPEYSKGVNGRADYALFGDNRLVALIEAKRLGEPLIDKVTEQVINYANYGNVDYALATDGNIWIVFDPFKRALIPQREIMRLVLETEPENLLLIKLASLMPANLIAGNNAFFPNMHGTIIVPVAPVQPPIVARTITEESVSQALLTPKVVSSNQSNTEWKSLTTLPQEGKIPAQLKFSDGKVVSIRDGAQMLVEVAEWLIKIKRLPHIPIPDKAGKKRYLINSTPNHPDGSTFLDVKNLSNGFYLTTNYPNKIKLEIVIDLLKKAGMDPNNCHFK